MADTQGEGEGHVGLFDAPGSTESEEQQTDTTENKGGQTSEIDWDSDDNPYKKRAQGFQSTASKLQNELDGLNGSRNELQQIIEGMNSINTRLDGVEDMAAEAADFSAGAGTGNDYDEDDSQSQESTNARTEGVRQRRQERATAQQAAAHANVVTEITAKIGSIYTAGMRDDPAVRKAAALFQEAVKDPSRTTDLYKALEMLRDEAPRFAESKETTEQGDDPPKGESESSSQGSDDSSNSDTDDEDDEEEVDETPTKREALIASTSTQGQRNNGISPSGDDSNMGALDMFEAHLSGKTPPGQ